MLAQSLSADVSVADLHECTCVTSTCHDDSRQKKEETERQEDADRTEQMTK